MRGSGRAASRGPRGWSAWVLGPLLFARAVAGAEAPQAGLSQLGLDRWGIEAGLAGMAVRDIVEGPDGFVWIATSGGLSRFDGRSFVNFTAATTPGLATNSITALAPAAGGKLWIGLEHGGVRSLRAGTIGPDPRLAALPAELSVRDLLEDRSGALWVATTTGLWRVSDQGLGRVAPPSGPDDADITRVVVSVDGPDVWARTIGDAVWRIREGVVATLPAIPGCRGQGLAAAPGGVVFTTCPDGVFAWDPARERWSTLSSKADRSSPLFLDRSGALWFGGREGLHHLARRTLDTLPPASGLGDWRARAFLEDERGDLWVGTYSFGLARLRRGAIRAFGNGEGLPLHSTTAVLARPDGDLWVGAFQQGLVRWSPDSGVVGRWTAKDGLPGETPWALAADPRQPAGVWVGGEGGLAWIAGGRPHRVGPSGVTHAAPVRVVFVDPASPGTVWVDDPSGGAVELRAAERTIHGRDRGLEVGQIRFFHRDRSGRLLAGGVDGLFRLNDGRWSPVSSGGGSFPALTALLEQADGTLWLASSASGLIRRSSDGDTVYGPMAGLPVTVIHSLQADRSGGIWLSTDEGLVRFRQDDHERWRRGEIDAIPFERLARRDGLRDAECNGWGSPAATQLGDGTLVYPTITGVALVEPALLPSVELAPPEIYVDAAWAGTRRLPLDAAWLLDAAERVLRIRFSAREFLRPEAVGFRYRLEGFDEGWVPAGRGAEATFARLSPGSFRFRLQARLPGGEWVEAPRAQPVVVEPQVVEAAWFRATALALVGGGVVAAFLWRVRIETRLWRSREEARNLSRQLIRAQEDERRQLARDIHDDLAQRLAGLAMLAWRSFQGVSRDRAHDVGKDLEELGGGLERIASDVQTLSRGLHPAALEMLGLSEALRAECAAFAKRTGLGVTYEREGAFLEPAAEVGLALYRIAQEGLRNCLAHSGARAASVKLASSANELLLDVADSGVGFDPSAVRARPGLGLASMRERARLAGGELELESAPGRGTRLRVRVPLRADGAAVREDARPAR